MATEEEVEPKGWNSIPEFIVYRPWTTMTVMFYSMLACMIPGKGLKKMQEILAMPEFDNDLVGEFSTKVTGFLTSYYVLWCSGCEITKHPEYFEDRGRMLRILQKVKEREHACRELTWFTHDDPRLGMNSSNYISSTGNVAYVEVVFDKEDYRECSHKLLKYQHGFRGQSSGDVHSGLASTTAMAEGGYIGMTARIMEHQMMLIPILLILMWSVTGGWWRSLTNVILASWAADSSNAFLLIFKAIWPGLEVGFTPGGATFICLAFCTDYSIFYWTRFQKEREEHPAKEMYGECVCEAIRKSGEVIICSSVVMIAAYCSTAFYPKMNDLGFMAMNLQIAVALFLAGLWNLTMLPAWTAAVPSMFENREPNNPNLLQKCLPAVLTSGADGKVFWKTWTGFVTRGKMMIIIPILAYGCMVPFVYCMTLYEPSYNEGHLMKFNGVSEVSAMNHLSDYFGSSDGVKFLFVLKATEIGPANGAAMLQVEGAAAGSNAEEVAFAQHAMKMSRKAHGHVFQDSLMMQPEFGNEVCKFSEQLVATMQDHHYSKVDASKIESVFYGRDPFGGGQNGCRTRDQIFQSLQKTGQKFDDMFEDYIHKKGEKTILALYPGVEGTSEQAVRLYRLLRDRFEPKMSHEFVMNGKRYWFEAKHTSSIGYLKETGVMMRRACPWVMGFTAAFAFIGVGLMFKAIFLPLKFVFTIIVPVAAIFGLTVAVYQEDWFGFLDDSNALSKDGGVNFILPYNQIGLLFGLAMDYDIFLFARVYEYRQDGYDNVSSVQKALCEIGPIVMTAGTFMCVSFLFMMMGGIGAMNQVGFLYFWGVFIDSYFTCTCIAPCVLCWGEWLNFFPGYIPPVSKKYNVDEMCDEAL